MSFYHNPNPENYIVDNSPGPGIGWSVEVTAPMTPQAPRDIIEWGSTPQLPSASAHTFQSSFESFPPAATHLTSAPFLFPNNANPHPSYPPSHSPNSPLLQTHYHSYPPPSYPPHNAHEYHLHSQSNTHTNIISSHTDPNTYSQNSFYPPPLQPQSSFQQPQYNQQQQQPQQQQPQYNQQQSFHQS